jgi:hypothetical protein
MVIAPVTALPLLTTFQAGSRIAKRQTVQSTSKAGSILGSTESGSATIAFGAD